MIRKFCNTFATVLLAVSGTLLISTQVSAEVTEQENVSIPFVNTTGVRDWRPQDDEAIYIEDNRGQWYLATFFAPCDSLRFSNAVGFKTDATGALDRFSSIVLRNEQCHFQSLVKSEDPALIDQQEESDSMEK